MAYNQIFLHPLAAFIRWPKALGFILQNQR
jgi:hypothetical protein